MAQKSNDKGLFSIGTIYRIIFNYWYWFAISVLFFLGLAVVHLLRTPNSYTRTAKILIKDDNSGDAELGVIAGFDFMSQKSNLWNELAIIQSPDLMVQVVEKLELNKRYFKDGTFHKTALYGPSLPIYINIDSVPRWYAGFTVNILDGKNFEIKKIKLDKDKLGETINGSFGKTVATPVGKVTIEKMPAFDQIEEFPFKIYFSESDVYTTALTYCNILVSNVMDQKSSIIEMSITDVSTKRADDILQSVIDAYNENWVNDKNQIAINTSKFIDERLRSLEKDLNTVDNEISTFKSSNLLPDVTATSNRYLDQASKANDMILELNNKIYMANYVKDYMKGISNDKTLPVNSGFESQPLSQQIAAYNTLVIERNNLVAVSSSNNPLVKQKDAALTDMRAAIEAAINNEIATLKNSIKNQEKSQSKALTQIAENPEQAKYLLSVERQQKVKESLYLFLLQKREENDLTQTFSSENARVIKAPNGSPVPASPRKMLILLMAIAAGLGIPYIILALNEMMNNTVRTRKDVEKITIPFLGEIPYYSTQKKAARIIEEIVCKVLRKKKKSEVDRIVVEKASRNVVNEAFRIIRTNLISMIGKDTDKNVIMITSYNPGSGKSFISMNLAMTFAFRGKKVLVIDCDLRHGSVSNYVNHPSMGLTNYLTDSVNDISRLITHYPNVPNLDVVAIGKVPPNPTELLENGRLATFIETVRNEYDYVFVDCPPIDIVADASIVAHLSNLTMFVIRAGLFNLDMLPDLQKLYDDKRFKKMGLVLNGTEMTKTGYYSSGKVSNYYSER